MMHSLQNIIFKYYLDNNLENKLKPFRYLERRYNIWKNDNYRNCACCKKLIDKTYNCQICQKYYYCLSCWDDYTYYCFYCNRHHCFTCNVKRRACNQCYR